MNLYPEMNDQIADILLLGDENKMQVYHYAGHYIKQLREQLAQYERKIAKGELKEVVHAHWIKQNYIDEPVICSNCKCCPAELQVTDGFLDEEYPYCPHCGAKMEVDNV